MMKKWSLSLLFVLSLILFAGCTAMQSMPEERALFAKNAPAEVQTPISTFSQEIAPGAVYWDLRYEKLFGHPQAISIIRIDWSSGNWQTALAFCGEKRRTVPDMAKSGQAEIAINGSFFAYSKVPRSTELLKINGKEHSPFVIRKGHGMIAFDRPGDFPRIAGDLSGKANALQAHPLLLQNGEIVCQDTSKSRHPRSLIGVTPQREVIVAVVDGRNKANAGGVTLQEAAILMQSLGCLDALNLDGGGSSTLYTKTLGVVNHPSDNKKFDHAGARKVNDAICFRRH